MKSERILDALGGVDEQFILEAAPEKRRRWVRWLAVAACLCLAFAGAVQALLRFDYLTMGCSAWPGSIVEGTYYYSVPHRGVYRYTPGGESQKLVSAFWEDGWLVNDYGVYYKRGRSLYVRVHETGKTRKLYTAGLFTSSHIGFCLEPDGNVVLTVYNKRAELRSELLLDGVTGEVLETVLEPTSYDDIFHDVVLPYSDAHFQVGGRELLLTPTGEENRYDLTENGVSILPDGVLISAWSAVYHGTDLWLACYEDIEGTTKTYFIVRPDGADAMITVPNRYYETGTEEFLFYVNYSGNSAWCLEVSSGECWRLETEDDWTFYSLSSDGEYLYSCVPWDDVQTCWRLVYDNDGRPAALELVEADISL